MSNDDTIELNAEISKRKLLGGLGVLGGATALGGVGTLALLSDSESFGNAGNANIIQAGEVDLEVDWEVVYFGPGSSPETIASQSEPVDRPGPIVDVSDLKPGDIIEKTLSTHINGNPAFLTFDLSVFADEDNGINNPEDAVDGAFNDSDGTEGGDLAENLNCVVWYDGFEDSDGTSGGSGEAPGNNRPDEGNIWPDGSDPTNDEEFEAALDSAGSPSDVFDIENDLVIASGTLAELANTENPILIDSRDQGDTPADYGDSACYDNGAVQYIGCVCWLPRDIPDVDDNIIQTDRLEYQFGFGAIQCRDNVAEDGTPISTDVATQPGGGGGGGDGDLVIDNFEDGNLDEYSGDTEPFETVSAPNFDGSQALRYSDAFAESSASIFSTSGLDRYPRQGEQFVYNVRIDDFADGEGTALQFGEKGQYAVRIQNANSTVDFKLSAPTSAFIDGGLANASDFVDTWYKVVINWGRTAIGAELIDPNSGASLSSIVVGEESGDQPYLGFSADPAVEAYFDYVRKTDAGDASSDDGQIIDNFEDNDLGEYTGDTGLFSPIVSPTFDGLQALGAFGSIGGGAISSTSGLDRYPRQGEQFVYNVRIDDFADGEGTALQFGEKGQYAVRIQNANSTVDFKLSAPTSAFIDGGLANASDFVDTWYKVVINWGSDTIEAELINPNTGATLSSIVVGEEGGDEPYLGFSIDNGAEAYFDYVRKTGGGN